MRRSERRKSEKKEDAGARKGRKVTIHCVFPTICGSRGSKSNLAKAAGAEPSGQMRNEKLHACGAKDMSNHVQVKMYKTHHVRMLRCRKSARRCSAKHISKLWKFRCRKSARCCGGKHIPSQECQNLTVLDHFWKLRCREIARRCGAKQISKSTV